MRASKAIFGWAAALVTAAATPSRADEVRLKDGAVIRGQIVGEHEGILYLQTPGEELARIDRSRIAEIFVPPPAPEVSAPARPQPVPRPETSSAPARVIIRAIAPPKTEPDIPREVRDALSKHLMQQSLLMIRENPEFIVARIVDAASSRVDYLHWLFESLLDDGMPELAFLVLHAIGQTREPDAPGRLAGYLDHPVPDVRAAAVTGLGRVANNEAVPVLSLALQDQDPKVIEAAVRALGQAHRAGADVSGVVSDLARSADAPNRTRAASVIGLIEAAWARDILRQLLEDADRAVRAHALLSAGPPPGTDPMWILRRMDDSGAEVREAACAWLEKHGTLDDVPYLNLAIGDLDPRVVSAAHDALRKLSGRDFGTNQARWVRWWEEEGPKRR